MVSWIALGIGGPRAVGVIMFAGGIVSPIAGPLIGHLIDRIGLRWLMLLDNSGRCLLMIGLSEIVRLGLVRLWSLLVIAVASAGLTAGFMAGGYLILALSVVLSPDLRRFRLSID